MTGSLAFLSLKVKVAKRPLGFSLMSSANSSVESASGSMSCCTKRLVTSFFGCLKTVNTSPSSTTFPNSITATLLQILRITFISCVIKTMVKFNFLLIANNKSNTSSVVCGSNALVASSQSRISGSFANARAIPTRCFCPPESCEGYACPRPSNPTKRNSSSARSLRLLFGTPANSSGSWIFSSTVLDHNRLKCWKIIPIFFRNVRNSLFFNFVIS